MMGRKITMVAAVVASLLLCSCSFSFEIGSMRDIGDTSSKSKDKTTHDEISAPAGDDARPDESVEAGGTEEGNGGTESEGGAGVLSEAGRIAMNAYAQFDKYDFVMTETVTRQCVQLDKEYNPIPIWGITTTGVHEKDGTMHHVDIGIVLTKTDEYMEIFPTAERVETDNYEAYYDAIAEEGTLFESDNGVWSTREVYHDASTMYYPTIFKNGALWDNAIVTEQGGGGYTVICTVPGYALSDQDLGMSLDLEGYFSLVANTDINDVHTTTAIFDFDAEGRLTFMRVPDIILDTYGGAEANLSYDAELELSVEYKDVSLQIPAEAMSR